MRVTVNLVGHIHDLIGAKKVSIELERPTIKGLIDAMAAKYGEEVRKAILKEGTEDLYILVLVNSKDIDFIRKLDTPLQVGDRVDMLPLITGG